MSDYQPLRHWGDGSRERSRMGAPDARSQGSQLAVPSVPLNVLFSVLRRHIRLILGTALLTLVPVFWYVYLRPPTFEARAVIRLVDARRAITGGLESETEEQPIGRMTDELLSQIQVLQGRTVLGEVVDREGLRLVAAGSMLPSPLISGVAIADSAAPDTLHLEFDGDGVAVQRGEVERRVGYGDTVDFGDIRFTLPAQLEEEGEAVLVLVRREEAVDFVIDGLAASPRTGTDVVDVVFTSRDSLLTQRVVNSVVDVFSTFDMRRAQETSARRVSFLESQLQQMDSVIAGAQNELSSFRAESQLYSSQGLIGDQQQALVSLDARWEELAASHRMYRDLLQTIVESTGDQQERAFRTLLASPEISANPAVAQLYSQLVGYQAQREELLAGPLGSTTESPDVRRVEALISGTRAKLVDAARSHLTSLGARLQSVAELRSRSRERAEPLPVLAATEERLVERVASAGRAAEQLRSELQQARMSEAVEAGRVQVVDYAPSADQTGSNGPIKLALGLILGLFLGAGGAFVAEAANTSIRRSDDIASRLGLPQLALIPKIQPLPERGLRRLTGSVTDVSGHSGDSTSISIGSQAAAQAAEAYRTLRTNLIFAARTSALRTLVVTSASPAEGKTTTAANLASSFAQQGFSTLLIDADLRNPRLHRVLSVDQKPGLSDVLAGECVIEDVIRVTSHAGLRLIPAGTRVENAAELLGLTSLREMLTELRNSYDLVILDTTPVLPAADAAILAAEADGVLMVIRAGQTERAAAEEALQQLAFAGGHLVGAVLNDPDSMVPRYGTYYGAYTYGSGQRVV